MLRSAGELLQQVLIMLLIGKPKKEFRVAKKGMWVQVDKYMSPRDWKRMNSEK